MNFNQLSQNKKIALLSICTALVALATFAIRFPAVANGYINFGDTFIFIFAFMFGPLCGAIAGGLGSALADTAAGYVIWAPFTLVIKGLEGWLCGALCYKLLNKSTSKLTALYSGIYFAGAALIMVVGYYFATAIILKSMQAALVSLPENLIQGSVSVAVAIIILFVFRLKNIKLF